MLYKLYSVEYSEGYVGVPEIRNDGQEGGSSRQGSGCSHEFQAEKIPLVCTSHIELLPNISVE